jgi:uncharacterized membrane protein YecN with MAPEG domain
MGPHITGLYAAPLGVLMVALTIHAIMARAKSGVSLLDGGNPKVAEAMRRHGNFAEAVPMALLLMAIAELLGTGTTWLHAVGLLLLVGRVLHPFGITYDKPVTFARIAGASVTLLATLVAAGNIAAKVI